MHLALCLHRLACAAPPLQQAAAFFTAMRALQTLQFHLELIPLEKLVWMTNQKIPVHGHLGCFRRWCKCTVCAMLVQEGVKCQCKQRRSSEPHRSTSRACSTSSAAS